MSAVSLMGGMIDRAIAAPSPFPTGRDISEPHAMSSERISRRRGAEVVVVVLLLAFHGLLAISSSRHKSATFDEVAHLGGGTLQWTDGDYRYNAESGALLQRWAAWPLLARDVTVPAADHPARADANVWILGREILYGPGNDADSLLLAGRGMIVILSLLLGGAVYCWSRSLFGQAGAWVSLALYTVSPTLLAHARLATADLAAALFFLLATRAIWSLLERVTPARIFAAAAAIAGLLLSKMSGLLILPIAAILITVKLRAPSGPRQPRRRLALLAGGIFATASLVYVALWAAYGFRYSARPEMPPQHPTASYTFLHSWDSMDHGAIAGTVLGIARRLELLPEAYLWGLGYTLQTTAERDAFLRGDTSATGWWWFFPYAVAVKTPLALFAILGLAALAWQRGFARPRGPTAPLWALLAVYGLAAITSHLNIGHRHMLPTYPVMLVLAGAAGAWLTRRSRLRPVLALALLAFAWESWAIRPHYLSYFNQLAGGPAGGYRHLVDSSLDWGQDLPLLAAFIAEQDDGTPVYAAYFGAAPPDYYGAEARWLYSFFPLAAPNRPPPPLTGGIYCVSVTLLQSMHMELRGPWKASYEQDFHQHQARVDRFVALSPDAEGREQLLAERSRAEWLQVFRTYDRLRSGRLFRFLLARQPEARIGYSIHVYRLSDDTVDRALHGPLPEWPGDA